jgi:hypothetical protein
VVYYIVCKKKEEEMTTFGKWDKRIVRDMDGNPKAALRMDFESGLLTIAGPIKMGEIVGELAILMGIIPSEGLTIRKDWKSIKYTGRSSVERWRKGLEKIANEGYMLETVISFRRFVR